MISLTARYFDGRTSASHQVTASLHDDGTLRLVGAGIDRRGPLTAVRIADRLGNVPRALWLPDGAKLETPDNDAVDAMVATLPPGRRALGLVHRLERQWRFALGALAVTAVLAFLGVEYVLPAAAERVAMLAPVELEHALGEETLEALDGTLFAPSELPPETAGSVIVRFEHLRRAVGFDAALRLELRSAPAIGANAFALPGGILVVTDELVTLLEDDYDALAAVLAHEVGHVLERHSLRAALQSSATALLIASVLGDVTSLSGLAATLPTVLVDARYSRRFEADADREAIRILLRMGVSPAALATALEAIERSHGGAGEVPGYLSSHPPTADRLERARAAAVTGRVPGKD
ncbi:MAG: M48 family metallopeptidase [Ectothiorhodospiraceae bacterium]|nr:M48 family metallopeptidase [Chromatiales bacterium]MCP5157317.1 M48 family metallopeptidase [Ectothiorhodospiraceae bacterium]